MRTPRSSLLVLLCVTLAAGAWPRALHAQAAEQVQYYHTDAIGSVRMITDAAGNVVSRYDYLPFGQPWPFDQDPEPRRFAGYERDLNTGSSAHNWDALDYAGARYYSSQTGRFISVDPLMLIDRNLADPQSWNRYAHVRNNPLRYVDPDGRAWETAWDVANLLYSLYECATGAGCTALAADALATVLPFVPAGTTRLLRTADDVAEGVFSGPGGLVIGKLDDLAKETGWRVGDHTLNLPPLPPGPGRWEQNKRALQDAINRGEPIRDVSPSKGGGFLDRERQLLLDNHWKFEPETSLWSPVN